MLIGLLQSGLAKAAAGYTKARQEIENMKLKTFPNSMSGEERKEIQEIFARVQIIGSSDTRRAANIAMVKVLEYDAAISWLFDLTREQKADFEKQEMECRSAIFDYIALVRVDLGTGDLE